MKKTQKSYEFDWERGWGHNHIYSKTTKTQQHSAQHPKKTTQHNTTKPNNTQLLKNHQNNSLNILEKRGGGNTGGIPAVSVGV